MTPNEVVLLCSAALALLREGLVTWREWRKKHQADHEIATAPETDTEKMRAK